MLLGKVGNWDLLLRLLLRRRRRVVRNWGIDPRHRVARNWGIDPRRRVRHRASLS